MGSGIHLMLFPATKDCIDAAAWNGSQFWVSSAADTSLICTAPGVTMLNRGDVKLTYMPRAGGQLQGEPH